MSENKPLTLPDLIDYLSLISGYLPNVDCEQVNPPVLVQQTDMQRVPISMGCLVFHEDHLLIRPYESGGLVPTFSVESRLSAIGRFIRVGCLKGKRDVENHPNFDKLYNLSNRICSQRIKRVLYSEDEEEIIKRIDGISCRVTAHLKNLVELLGSEMTHREKTSALISTLKQINQTLISLDQLRNYITGEDWGF